MPSANFKDELLAEIRNLRAFAISLSGSVSLADDLVQESLLRAWSNSEKFQPGTSLRAWLFTILRNIYYSNYRKRSREVQDSDGLYARRLTVPGDQESHLDLEDFRKAMTKLPAEQREVLTLIGASGLSYEEAAVVCQVGIGTIKSRLSRARAKLVELLELDDAASELAGRAQGSARRLARALCSPGVNATPSVSGTEQSSTPTPARATGPAFPRSANPSTQPGSVRGATSPYRERTGRPGGPAGARAATPYPPQD